MHSSTRRDACIHPGHCNSGCGDGGRAMPGFAPRNRVSQGGGQGSPAVLGDHTVQVPRQAPGYESKQKFGDIECPQQPCYVKGHGHAKPRTGKQAYALRQHLKNDSQKLVSRPPTIIPCEIPQQALCGDPTPHYHFRSHIYPKDDAMTLDDAGASITRGCSAQVKDLARSTTTLIQRVEGIKARLLAHDDLDPGEVDYPENENEEHDEKLDLTDNKHVSDEDDEDVDDVPTALPIFGDRLSRDKVTLAVAVATESKYDIAKPNAIQSDQVVVRPTVTVSCDTAPVRQVYENYPLLWNIPEGTKISYTKMWPLYYFYEFGGPIPQTFWNKAPLSERIIYNTTGTGGDVYDNGLLNSFILWLCGSQTDLKRNAQFELMLPEYTQFKSTDSSTVNSFLGFNLDQYVKRKSVYGRSTWFSKFIGVKRINGDVQRDDVFDVVALLGYTSYSVEKIILPLLKWLQSSPVTQSREVFGTDGKHRAFTRGQIMSVCQESNDWQQWRDLGDAYFENTVDYYVQLMAVRDVHKYFRQSRVDLSLRPLNGAPSAKNMCPSRGAQS